MRLIDGDKLREQAVDIIGDSAGHKAWAILSAITMAPTIEERKTGKWIHDGEAFEGGIDWMHCSECGHKDVWCNAGRTPYCSNCGCRMVQEGEDK